MNVKNETMNKMAVIKWYDPDTCDTIVLAAQAYGIEIVARKSTGLPSESYVCIYGPIESIDAFITDVNEDCIEPFESKRELSDNDYQNWLSNELQKFGYLYIPNYINEEDDNED